MPIKQRGSRQMKTPASTRASVTFPPEIYYALEGIARTKKVSVAWVVRDAAERYVMEEKRQNTSRKR